MKALILWLALLMAPAEFTLPDDDVQFAGPDADLLNANCLSCHSASMVLLQPRMSAEQWGHTVEKMRTVYKAPVEDADAAQLPAALARVQGD
ncbi:hypothetical protein HJG53_03010 [Sphingomonas sp. ID1715]|uniref:hypothetical protein n=1 Tax=Sphingomonas sp. ID1715 TaxID=1656898 RepID=UPI00148762D7|nr:hypothetical protein [Sphingomonas sp. ID1715]NNM75876.1 hypothetical protein [Sphingomonas sp. ID1715]